MMRTTVVRCAVAVLLFAGCLSPVMTFGSGKTAKQSQREILNDQIPVRLVPTATWAGEVTRRKVRVWAAALDSLLTATFAEDPETEIVIEEDRKVPEGAVVALIDRAKAIGFTKFSMGWADQ